MKNKMLFILGSLMLCMINSISFASQTSGPRTNSINNNLASSESTVSQSSLLTKIKREGILILKSGANKNRLTAEMRDALIEYLSLRLNEQQNTDFNACNTQTKGKARYVTNSGKLQYCDGAQWKNIPSSTFEPTEVLTDERGIKIWFYMHHVNTNFPNCPGEYTQLRRGETENGAFRKNRRSTLCYQKLPSKTVPIGSKCVKDYRVDKQDGISFTLKYREGSISKFGTCVSSNKEGSIYQRVGTNRDPRTRELPLTDNFY